MTDLELLFYATEMYDKGTPIMSDEEWDKLYFSLGENAQEIHYKFTTPLETVRHCHPMLSLDKTKSVEDINSFIGDNDVIAMLKLDGLTLSLTYINGQLARAETRGNGEQGEDVTHNAMVIDSIPKIVDFRDYLVVDGEIICKTDDFIDYDIDEEYENPRNYAAGSIRLLSAEECAKRHLTFVAWDCIKGFEEVETLSERLDELGELGFTIVPYSTIINSGDSQLTLTHLEYVIDTLRENAAKQHLPIDGIVFKYDYVQKYNSMGKTNHHFKGGLALKFYDKAVETKLIDIEYEVSRNGILTPVATFEPIRIEGTTVSRASLYNLSQMYDLAGTPRVGDTLQVIKSNQIIPKIIDWENGDGDKITQPVLCPKCNHVLTEIVSESGTRQLVCDFAGCSGKLAQRVDYFCSKKGFDIKGLSTATIEKLMEWGWLEELYDLFLLRLHREEWTRKPGFGVASVDKILDAIDKAKDNITFDRFLAAFGIPLIGPTVAKEIAKHAPTYEEYQKLRNENFDFSQWGGIGRAICHQIMNQDYWVEMHKIATIVTFKTPEVVASVGNNLSGEVICITGKLALHKNRAELKAKIEARGGKVTDAITSKTTCLINNDLESGSAKNTMAKMRGLPIVSEKEFTEKFLTN